MDEGLLLQQRVEAKAAMVRLFRFRARRGVGVRYALSSLFLLALAALDALSSSRYVILGLAAVWLGSVYWANAAGFKGFVRMSNSMDLVDGAEVRNRARSSRYGNPTYLQLLPILWASGFVIAGLEGWSLVSVALLGLLIGQLLIVRFSMVSKGTDSILEPHSEDWIIPIAMAALLGLVILNHSAIGAGIAAVCCLFSGFKSLYEAPKEMTEVSS